MSFFSIMFVFWIVFGLLTLIHFSKDIMESLKLNFPTLTADSYEKSILNQRSENLETDYKNYYNLVKTGFEYYEEDLVAIANELNYRSTVK